MNRVIALWAVPRSVSTAFEQMMRARGDFRVLHEPFLPYYYYGEERVNDHFSDGVEPDPSHDWRAILEQIREDAAEEPVFFKDMAYYLSRVMSPELLRNFDNAFLVRDPERSLRSLFRLLPEATMEETGFEQQLRLMRMVDAETDQPIVVVDSERLREDPGPEIERFCEQMGIEFIPEALEWEQGEPDEDWRPWRAWHNEAIHSTGFEAKTDEHKAEVEIPPEALARCKEAYEEMLELARSSR